MIDENSGKKIADKTNHNTAAQVTAQVTAQVAVNIHRLGVSKTTAKTILKTVLAEDGCDIASAEFIKENLSDINSTLDFLYAVG